MKHKQTNKPADHRAKIKESKKARQIPGYCLRAEKSKEHEDNGDTDCNLGPWNDHQRSGKEIGGTGIQWKNRDHPDHSTVKISEYTKNFPAELR